MRRWVIAVGFVAAGGMAWASGYDDYMRGYEARRAGRFDLALSSFTAALAAADLAETYKPDAHVGRADVLLHKGRCAEAMNDLDVALTLRPKLIEALIIRAHVNACLGHYDAALADLDTAVAAAPTTDLYALRGSFRWDRGDFAAAAADFMQSAKLQPKRAFDPREGVYSLIWYAIAASRAKTFDAAMYAAAAYDLDDDEWPGPLMSFITGRKKADEIYREAARGDGDIPSHRKCEADFFIAEWQYASGDPAGKTLLQSLPQTCPTDSTYIRHAQTDLQRFP